MSLAVSSATILGGFLMSVTPWALLEKLQKYGHRSAVETPGFAQRSDSCLTECNNCDAAVCVPFKTRK